MEEIRGPAPLAMFANKLQGTWRAPVEDETLDSAEATTASEPDLTIFIAIKQQLGLAIMPTDNQLLDPLDLGADPSQFLLDLLVAAIDVIHPIDHGLSARHQSCKYQGRAGPKV
jgi:hypothetical protein